MAQVTQEVVVLKISGISNLFSYDNDDVAHGLGAQIEGTESVTISGSATFLTGLKILQYQAANNGSGVYVIVRAVLDTETSANGAQSLSSLLSGIVDESSLSGRSGTSTITFTRLSATEAAVGFNSNLQDFRLHLRNIRDQVI